MNEELVTETRDGEVVRFEGVGGVLVGEGLAPEGGEGGSREEGVHDPLLES